MSKPAQPAKSKSGVSWLAVVAVGILMIAAMVGWWAFALNRLSTLPTTNPTSVAQRHPAQNPGATPTLAQLVQPTVGSGTPTPTMAAAMAYGVVTSRQLNVRAEPNTSANTLGALKNGDIVPLALRNGGWYQTTSGGWISALYLEVWQTREEAQSYVQQIKPG